VSKKIKMYVEMEVTISQGLALQAMFEHWNFLSNMGSSRLVAFFVDGDGNFHPKVTTSFSEVIPELTKELKEKAMIGTMEGEVPFGGAKFDFDPIAWKLDELYGEGVF